MRCVNKHKNLVIVDLIIHSDKPDYVKYWQEIECAVSGILYRALS